ncbi:unnamed protein product, partial [Dicrocoelium dendriticum]
MAYNPDASNKVISFRGYHKSKLDDFAISLRSLNWDDYILSAESQHAAGMLY